MERRFKDVLALLEVPQEVFVKLPGVTSQNLYSAYRRGVVGEAHIARLRELASRKGLEGVTIDWLEEGIGEPPRYPAGAGAPAIDVAGDGVIQLPSHPIGTPSGQYLRFQFLEGYANEPTRFIDIPSSLLRENVGIALPSVRVYPFPQDVMRGEIEKGDLVFVDTAVDQVQNDGVYAYKIGGIPSIRRIQVRGKDVLRFQGTHTYEDSMQLSGPELADLEIGGRVIGSLGCKKF